MALALLGCLSALILGSAAASAPHVAAPTANTTCGPVVGTTQMIPDGSVVEVFKSIPYAKPPLGELRWAAPQSPACWEGTYNATRFKHVCLQEYGVLGAEDCLFLDVHRPAGLPPGAPVVFYIHGGSLLLGAGQWEYVDVLAVRLGAVVVTVQYRLGVLGWLCIEGMEACNWGLLDQQAALRWVRDNAEAFGGDPALVTVAGQSSGGTSIFALLSSPASAGLFSGALSMSGSPNISIGLPAAYAQNAGVANATGCAPPGSSPAQRIACLRALPARRLALAMPSSWTTPGLWSLAGLSPSGRDFAGLPVVDGSVIIEPFADALAHGLVDVPLIVGNMGQECDLAPGQDVERDSLAEWRALLNETLAPWDDATFSDAVWAAYLNDSLVGPQRAYDSLNTDYGIGCANAQLTTAAKGGAYSSPVFAYVAEWPPSRPLRIPGGRNITSAFHTWDWSAVCGEGGGCMRLHCSLPCSHAPVRAPRVLAEHWLASVIEPGPTDISFARELQAAWRAFLRTRRPPPPWGTVDSVPGFPAHRGAYVFGTATLQPHLPSAFTTDFRARFCELLASAGFDSRYWWCN